MQKQRKKISLLKQKYLDSMEIHFKTLTSFKENNFVTNFPIPKENAKFTDNQKRFILL